MHAGPASPLRRALIVLVTSILTLAAACSSQGGEPAVTARPPGSKVVRFPAAGGPELGGTLTGKGKAGVILAHQYNADQSAWYPFASELVSKGYLVLTFNFRGFCPGGIAGCSQGDVDPGRAGLDLQGAMSFMRDQGVAKLFVVGASMGGTAALTPKQLYMDAAVMISAPEEFRGLQAEPEYLPDGKSTKRATPTLFIAGGDDPAGAAGAARRLYDAAPKPKQILVVPSEGHGAYLLADPASGEEVRQAILRFLDLYRSAA